MSPVPTGSTTTSTAGQYVGFNFTVGSSPIQVLYLASYCVAGNTHTHTVVITKGDGTLTASVAIPMTGCTGGTQKWASISPVTLSASTAYIVAEDDAGDVRLNEPTFSNAPVAFNNGPVFSSAPTSGYSSASLPFFTYGAPNFSYGAAGACSAVQTGNWSSPATWGTICAGHGPSGVPGNGDTASIFDGVTVTGDQNMVSSGCPVNSLCLGTSPSSGFNCVLTHVAGNTTAGVLELSGGVHYVQRGSECFPPSTGTVTATLLILDAGSSYMLDSSQASPTSTVYYGGSTSYVGTVASNGTSGSQVTITSNTSGANGVWGGMPGYGNDFGGQGAYTYTNFSNLGSATTAGYRLGVWSGLDLATSFSHCTFDSTGGFGRTGSGGNGPTAPFSFTRNVFTHSLFVDPVVSTLRVDWNVPHSSTGGIARTMSNNVFDGTVNGSDAQCTSGGGPTDGFVVTGNYFTMTCWANGLGPTISGNLFAMTYDIQLGVYSATNNYSYNPVSVDNSRNFAMHAAAMFSGNIIDIPNDSTADTGESIITGTELWTGTMGSPGTLGYTNNIILKTATGHASTKATTVIQEDSSNLTLQLDHNTMEGGFLTPGLQSVAGLVAVDEGGTAVAHITMRGNVQWNPTTSALYRLQTNQPTGSGGNTPSVDICAVGNCSYNAGYGLLYTWLTGGNPACTSCVNPGNSYFSSWSVTPGTATDIDIANPVYSNAYPADTRRRLATWDTLYLGNAIAPAWATNTSYSQGQIFSVTLAGLYEGLSINYRCLKDHTSDASTQPQLGAGYLADWELASLYDLRTAIAGGVTYTDGALNCSACDPIAALVAWTKRGRTPQQQYFRGYKFGGDGNAVTNPGAVLMDSPIAIVPVSNL